MSLADELLADLEGAETSEELITDSNLHEVEDVTMLSVNKSDDFQSNVSASGFKNVLKAASFADAPITAYAKLRNSDRANYDIDVAFCSKYSMDGQFNV
ncbi:unnamed protein product [Schistosoma turkestanicum]|nr:unnamed protein product [Schistosoma turkestanicum]